MAEIFTLDGGKKKQDNTSPDDDEPTEKLYRFHMNNGDVFEAEGIMVLYPSSIALVSKEFDVYQLVPLEGVRNAEWVRFPVPVVAEADIETAEVVLADAEIE